MNKNSIERVTIQFADGVIFQINELEINSYELTWNGKEFQLKLISSGFITNAIASTIPKMLEKENG